jgi:glycosyltransferase involved in cell wall biosynthesis
LKIAHVNMGHLRNPVFFGGAEVRNYELYRRLAERGHDITIVSSRFSGARPYEAARGLKYLFVGAGCDDSAASKIKSSLCFSAAAAAWLQRHAREHDVIVEELSYWSPALAPLVRGRPVVLQIQNVTPWQQMRQKSGLIVGAACYLSMKGYPRLFRRWIVLGEPLNERYGIRGEVIPQGIDEALLASRPAEGDYLGFLGRLDVAQKGIDLLLDAVAVLRDRGLAVPLKLAGKGSDEPAVRARIQKLGLERQVELAGWLEGDAKRRFLEGARLVILPSRFEGQGIAAIEAAACHKPLIVSSIPELRYVVEHGFGIAFERFEPAAIASAIERLWGDSAARVELGKHARAFAERSTWTRSADQLERYLSSVCAGQR